MAVPCFESCYLNRPLFTEQLHQSNPIWDAIEPNQYLLQFRKTDSFTRLYSCRHGRRQGAARSFGDPVIEAYQIQDSWLDSRTSSVECVRGMVREQGIGLSQPDIQHIAAFLVQMRRSRFGPGTRAMAVVDVTICRIEHVDGCVIDDESESVDSEASMSESDLEDDAVSVKKTVQGCIDETCSICWDEFCEGDEYVRTACSHVFHQACIGTWMTRKTNCPLCRRDIQM